MKRNQTIFKIACSFIIIGLILSIIGYLMGAATHINITKSGIKIGSRETIMIDETLTNFNEIDINLDYYDQIEIIASDYFGIKAQYQGDIDSFTYEVKDGKLSIEQQPAITVMNLNIIP